MTSSPNVAVRSPAVQALYVFCVACVDALTTIDGAGFDGHRRLQLIPFGDLVAVASNVSVDDFCGPAAEALLRDLAWIGPRACHHEAVVEQVMRSSPVVPARFATLFSSRQRLDAWLEKHHASLSSTLDRVAGHEEWGVTGRLDRENAEARLLAADRERRTLSTSPGARYMEEQRIRARVDRELDVWLDEVREWVAAELLLHAVEFRERAVVPGASVGDGIGIWNWAFLVARQRLGDFNRCVQRIGGQLDEQGLALEASGPWPPYSFCPPLEPEALG